MAGATLRRDGLRLVLEGRTTIDEAMRVSAQPDE
jgi:MSHA biogenesis protein MshE